MMGSLAAVKEARLLVAGLAFAITAAFAAIAVIAVTGALRFRLSAEFRPAVGLLSLVAMTAWWWLPPFGWRTWMLAICALAAAALAAAFGYALHTRRAQLWVGWWRCFAEELAVDVEEAEATED